MPVFTRYPRSFKILAKQKFFCVQDAFFGQIVPLAPYNPIVKKIDFFPLGQELHHLAKLNQYLCGILSESGLVENSPTRLGRAVFRYRKSPLKYGEVNVSIPLPERAGEDSETPRPGKNRDLQHACSVARSVDWIFWTCQDAQS